MRRLLAGGATRAPDDHIFYLWPRVALAESSALNVKIEISDTARAQLEVLNLDLDIDTMIREILPYVPAHDQIGVSHIYVTWEPEDHKELQKQSMGAYYPKGSQPAFIAVYVRNLPIPLARPDLARYVAPIVQAALAESLFGQFGSHVASTRSHGLRPDAERRAAVLYGERLSNKYKIARAKDIDDCIDHLESIADSHDLPPAQIQLLRNMWHADRDKSRRLQ